LRPMIMSGRESRSRSYGATVEQALASKHIVSKAIANRTGLELMWCRLGADVRFRPARCTAYGPGLVRNGLTQSHVRARAVGLG
jgi:hypothetical protein